MKICVTTSDKYHHCLRIFCYLFTRNWSNEQPVDVVGYKHPDFVLPSNFTFYSMGEQGPDASCFSGDLRKYFEQQDEWFVWLFEDSFIRSVDLGQFEKCDVFMKSGTGRIPLTTNGLRFQEVIYKEETFDVTQKSIYRLSTQPSIWNRDFLLKYLTPGLNPWSFEKSESYNDGYRIVGFNNPVIIHNEGVTKNDIYLYDLNGIPEEQIQEMAKFGMI